MSIDELELAYLRAMQEWIHQQHNTHMVAMTGAVSMYSTQQATEDAAHKRYQQAQLAFLNRPKE
jgi:hypothetical protein